jgi:nicotinate-nucleotide adenylyltransferase
VSFQVEWVLEATVVQKKRKIGLFGGTFNPIHLGHLRGAEEVRELCGLDEIVFIPAAIPPHKEAAEVIEATHRLEMLRLATRTNPHFSVSTVEMERRGTSYSIDTIRFFLEKDQGAISFILGRDAFVEIETWREYPTLFSLCSFIVMDRPGVRDPSRTELPQAISSAFRYDEGTNCWIHHSGQTVRFQNITFLDISSTKVRELVEKRQSAKYLIPREVEAYIQDHGLYRQKN